MKWLLALFMMMMPLAVSAQAVPKLVPDVSQRNINIQSGFTGAELLLFGAIIYPRGISPEGQVDVAVVLRGPARPITLREKQKIAGIWINADSTDFRSVPVYYAIASSRPLSSIVEQILSELRLEDPARLVEIHVEPRLIAAADRALIRVALENLLRNAWKFTSRREVAQIRFHAEMRDRQIVYCVSDNGAGFDMSFASKLFLPFHRLHGISEFAGTGIGLATVQRVIQRHEGRVWAQSVPDEGASFFFTLSH